MLRINKSGEGLSLSTIVVAILALLVLVILSVIFMNSIGTANKGFQACDGVCLVSKSDCQQGWVAIPRKCDAGGGSSGAYCCVPLSGQ